MNKPPLSLESLLDQIFDVAGTEDAQRKKIKDQIYRNLSNLLNSKQAGGHVEESELHQALLGPLRLVLPFHRWNTLQKGSNLNLSRAKYRDACLHRSPKFQKALLQFHQEFPPIFRPAPQGRKFSILPSWLRDRLTSNGPNLYFGSLTSLEDLRKLQSMSAEIELVRHRWERLLPDQGPSYFKALGKQARTYQRKLNRLQQQWPHVRGEVFTSGDLNSGNAFPALLIPPIEEFGGIAPGQPRINQREWNRTLIQAGKTAVLMIPIWPHTVESDVNWDQIRRWKVALSSTTIPRTHDTVLGTRLAVYDRYQELRSFAAVGKELKIPKKTVRDHFLRVYQDIHGEPLKGSKKTRRIQGVDDRSHVPNCNRCSRADRIEDFCHTGIALVNIAESSTSYAETYDDNIDYSDYAKGKRTTPHPRHD
jgi:hypothetical protein